MPDHARRLGRAPPVCARGEHPRHPPRLPHRSPPPRPGRRAHAERPGLPSRAHGVRLQRGAQAPHAGPGFPEGARLAGTRARGRLRVAHAAGPEATNLFGRGAERAQPGDPRPPSRLKPVETAPLPQKHRARATGHFRDCPESVRGRRSARL